MASTARTSSKISKTTDQAHEDVFLSESSDLEKDSSFLTMLILSAGVSGIVGIVVTIILCCACKNGKQNEETNNIITCGKFAKMKEMKCTVPEAEVKGDAKCLLEKKDKEEDEEVSLRNEGFLGLIVGFRIESFRRDDRLGAEKFDVFPMPME